MRFLKELLEHDKYLLQTEGVDAEITTNQPNYVQLPKPTSKKKKKKSFPTSDSAENSLINTLWLYQNADAS